MHSFSPQPKGKKIEIQVFEDCFKPQNWTPTGTNPTRKKFFQKWTLKIANFIGKMPELRFKILMETSEMKSSKKLHH